MMIRHNLTITCLQSAWLHNHVTLSLLKGDAIPGIMGKGC